jgi:hypothetical protein
MVTQRPCGHTDRKRCDSVVTMTEMFFVWCSASLGMRGAPPATSSPARLRGTSVRACARGGAGQRFVFGRRRAVSTDLMDLRRPLLVLALAGSLVACGGDNTDLQRGETNCDSSGEEAANPHDASCEETGTTDDEN